MPNTIVNLGDLRRMVDRYAEVLDSHDAVSLTADGERAEPADRADIDAVVQALLEVSNRIGRICQQPVLAVHLTER